MKKIKHLDLFSGIGGFALAAKRIGGIETIGFSEIEQSASDILKHHHPNVRNYGDIRKIKNIKCDIITGGFPCQPFSSMGNGDGKKDDRYLWPEMLRVISESGCKWVIAENVPRIINLALDDVLDDLEGQGFSAWAANIPACAAQAPHFRPRVWVVAHRQSIGINGVVGECKSKAAEDGESGRHSDGRPYGINSTMPASRWETWDGKSRVCRVVNGVSQRIHGLGNAIVPQVAEQLIRCAISSPNSKRCHGVAVDHPRRLK
jgi:DNA (cytosine-5)-methyltransferase 1